MPRKSVAPTGRHAAGQLTAERLRSLASYDPATGVFTWIVARSGVAVGPAGCLSGSGYIYLTVDGKKYPAHRLAWLFVHGQWPEGDIDHINLDRTDNRLVNLRAVTREVNNQNRRRARSDNRSGRIGVSWYSRSNCWRARVMVRGEEYRLGLFQDPDAAHKAYIHAKRALHKGCTL